MSAIVLFCLCGDVRLGNVISLHKPRVYFWIKAHSSSGVSIFYDSLRRTGNFWFYVSTFAGFPGQAFMLRHSTRGYLESAGLLKGTIFRDRKLLVVGEQTSGGLTSDNGARLMRLRVENGL